MKYLIFLIFFIPTISVHFVWAQAPEFPWQKGLSYLQRAAQNEPIEKFGLYMATPGSDGEWVFPETKESTEDSVRFSKDLTLKLFEEMVNAKGLSKEDSIHLVVAHTHPASTIEQMIFEDNNVFLENKSLYHFLDLRGPLSMPPSRSDLAVIYEVDDLLKMAGFKNVQVFGVVIDPSGVFTHRLFKSRDEKYKLFPELADEIPYEHLDLSDQGVRDQQMSDQLYESTRDWVHDVNQWSASVSEQEFRTFKVFRGLRATYAAYGIGAFIDYRPGAVEIPPPGK